MFLLFAALLASPASSKWTVDFADAHCEATRTYGSGERALVMSIRPPLDPAATTRLTFEREIRELSGELQKSAMIDFADGGPPYRTFMQPALSRNGFRYMLDLPQDQARRLRGSKVIDLKTSARVSGRFEIGQGTALFEALDRCVDDLRKRVGVDGELSGVSRPAAPTISLDRLFSSSNFWTAEFRRAKTNRITVSLLIDKAGAVRDCSIVRGTGSAALDTQSCQVFLQKVRFLPARNGNGEAIASLQHQTVEWRR